MQLLRARLLPTTPRAQLIATLYSLRLLPKMTATPKGTRRGCWNALEHVFKCVRRINATFKGLIWKIVTTGKPWVFNMSASKNERCFLPVLHLWGFTWPSGKWHETKTLAPGIPGKSLPRFVKTNKLKRSNLMFRKLQQSMSNNSNSEILYKLVPHS